MRARTSLALVASGAACAFGGGLVGKEAADSSREATIHKADSSIVLAASHSAQATTEAGVAEATVQESITAGAKYGLLVWSLGALTVWDLKSRRQEEVEVTE